MTEEPSFTLQQAIEAQRRLRETIGLGEERFPVAAFVGMVSDEIDGLRKAGHSDADIVGIVAEATGIAMDPESIGRFYVPPEERHPRG